MARDFSWNKNAGLCLDILNHKRLEGTLMNMLRKDRAYYILLLASLVFLLPALELLLEVLAETHLNNQRVSFIAQKKAAF